MPKFARSDLKSAPMAVNNEYKEHIRDLVCHEAVCSMKNFPHHGDLNCLQHSLNVSYHSYLICKKLRLDHRAAARGGLLHDLFLYDWHETEPEEGLHGIVHPRIALKNAEMYFELSDKERDIILKHMWPVTFRRPRYRESFVVTLVDKYCAVVETLRDSGGKRAKKLLLGLDMEV